MTSEQNENLRPENEENVTPVETPAEAAAEPAPEPAAPAPEPEEAAAPVAAAGDEAGEGEDGDSGEFAAMLAESENAAPAEAKAGDKVSGTIVQIDDSGAFVDCGLRNEVPLALEEIQDGEGKLTKQVGDKVSGKLAKGKDGDLKLVISGAQRDADRAALKAAFEAGTPVEGKVGETNKGGFSVHIGKIRAFCPFSQIDLRRADDPTVFVGNKYPFKILEFSPDGRNVVVSRRAYLQETRETEAADTRRTLALGDAREGTVTRLVPFGAFVDIGGVEGLVHISQISHQRVGDPSDVLREGQQVKVKVLEIQNLGQGRSERISLSIKALASDPWPDAAGDLQPGSDVNGRVTRLVDFGVFVELLPGIEGLIHISELANRRIIHPREVLNEDEEITVRVLDIDLGRRRISLSRRQTADYDGD
jgi:small subunit ribosomal protein S1